MIIFPCVQGSEEWLQARAGKPTASSFDKIITTSGKPSTSAKKYMYQLAGERIAGAKEEGYKNGNMDRGIELEPEAREYYEVITGNKVEQVGICYPDEKKLFSCSPDGFVGEDGIIEIKCPTLSVHVEYLLKEALPTDYIQQVQGNLFITGRKYCDFISYYPSLKPLVVRVERDEVFIKALSIELEVFTKQLEELTEKIR